MRALVSLAAVLALWLPASAAAGKRGNFPLGWQWPPSQEMRRYGDGCLRQLDDLGVRWKKARPTRLVATAIVVPDMTFAGLKVSPLHRDPPFVMDCQLAAALAKHAPRLRAVGIAELRFSSILDVRTVRVNGGKKSMLSRHALGLAIDVFEMVGVDGAVYVVENDYRSSSSPLKRVEQSIDESGLFRLALTPGKDPRSHYDHFHLEAQFEIPEAMARVEEAKRSRRNRHIARRERAQAQRRARAQARRERARARREHARERREREREKRRERAETQRERARQRRERARERRRARAEARRDRRRARAQTSP